MAKFNEKQIKLQNKLLRQLPEIACFFELGNYQVNILDVHFHLPDFKSSPWHSHSYFEAHIIFNGHGEIVTYKGSREFKAGDMLITPPNFEHSWQTEADDLYMYVVSFELKVREDSSSRPAPIDMAFSRLFEIEEFISDSNRLQSIVLKIIEEISGARPGLNYILECYMKELVISFARLVNSTRPELNEQPEEKPDPREDQIVILINKYLADNYTNDINLDMIARFVCKSKRSITRHYKEITGTTIIDKLLQMRLFLAENLLTDTDKPVKTVAYEVGMPDVSYFCRQFKKVFNCSPTKYREVNPGNTTGDTHARRFDALALS
ncbi:MAG: helix-turn-helix domain-containing protein [Sedimentisphaeraceae bacterium JB056]